jgi:anaerobic magnesium-protoporphyrin IX monomethyl ester cyclase
MKVLLISPKVKESCYHKFSKWENVGLGLLYLVSSLKEKGFDAKVVLTDREEVKEILNNYQPDVVGMTSVTSTYNTAISILKVVKSYDESIITVMGGHHVTFTVEETLNEPSVDYVIRGEGEEVFPALLKNIMKKKPHELLEGVCFKKGNRIYNEHSVALVKDINTLPFPDRSAVEHYDFPGIYMLSSRGCPFKCTFCSASNLYGGVWRKRSVENVLDELEGMRGIKNNKVTVQFGDETMTVDTRWAKEFCRGIIKRGLKFSWYSNSRVDSINRDLEMLQLMKEAGCKGVSLGIESGVQEIIDSYNKGITLEQALRAAEKLRDFSMYQQWYLMVGSGNKYDEPVYLEKSIEFMKDFPFDLVQISILTPFPGTKLYNQLEKEGRLLHKNWDYYDGLHCVYRPLGMTAEKLEEELNRAYREIYLHSGLKNLLQRIYRFKHAVANSRSFLTFINLIIKVGLFKQDIRMALE